MSEDETVTDESLPPGRAAFLLLILLALLGNMAYAVMTYQIG